MLEFYRHHPSAAMTWRATVGVAIRPGSPKQHHLRIRQRNWRSCLVASQFRGTPDVAYSAADRFFSVVAGDDAGVRLDAAACSKPATLVGDNRPATFFAFPRTPCVNSNDSADPRSSSGSTYLQYSCGQNRIPLRPDFAHFWPSRIYPATVSCVRCRVCCMMR
jgi:hypothetical protein